MPSMPPNPLKNMKIKLVTGAILLGSLGLASAQGLYDLAPNDEAQESSPISWSAGVSYNYDNNVTPTVVAGSPGYKEDASSISAYVGASMVNITSMSTYSIVARVGANTYLDSPSAAGVDDVNYQARLGLNWSHNVSERLRFSSNNSLAFELEPDYSYGYASDRQFEEYLYYSSNNSVGYRWTERFATYTSLGISGLVYDSVGSANDRTNFSFNQQFRYTVSEKTNWTLDYGHTWSSASGTASDSGNHVITAGIEHRFSPYSVLVLKAGAQIRSVNGGADTTSPYFNAAIRTQVNEQFRVSIFARYSVEDYGTSFPTYTYDSNRTLRSGVTASYVVSPRLTMNAGANLLLNNMGDGRLVPSGTSRSDADIELINLYLGCSLKLSDRIYATASYNWTDSNSSGAASIPGRTYNRSVVSVGLGMQF